MKPRKLASSLLKACVSLALLFYVFEKAGWSQVWEELRDVSLGFLLAYLALSFASIAISAWKWWVLCRARAIEASFGRLVLLYLVGMFFNHLLPTSVGGDVVRGLELSRRAGRRAETLASVFVERFTGLTALLLLAALAVALDRRFLAEPAIAGVLGLLGVGYVAGTLLVLSPRVTAFLARSLPRVFAQRLDPVRRFQEAIHAYRHHGGALWSAMALSLLFYASSIATTWAGLEMFGVRASLLDLSLAVPVMLVLFMIPISLGGIGLQEWAYMFVLGTIGVPEAVGLSVGILYRAKAVGFGLIGGALYATLFMGRPAGVALPRSEEEAPDPSG